MGQGDWNIMITTHSQPGAWQDHQVRVHHGDQGVDTSSPLLLDRGDYLSLKNAASVSQGAFDGQVQEIGGTFASWYFGLTPSARSAVRDGYGLL